jgi:transposase
MSIATASWRAAKTQDSSQNDAKGIADAVRCNLYREVAQKSQNSIEIITLMGCRRLLVSQKNQQANAIRGFLKSDGIRLGSIGEASFIQIVREQLPKQPSLATEGLQSLLLCYEKVCGELKKLTKKIEELARKDEEVKRLMTLPGIGSITVLAFKVEIDDPRRFKNSRAVGAYLGMIPRQYSSVEKTRTYLQMRLKRNEVATHGSRPSAADSFSALE